MKEKKLEFCEWVEEEGARTVICPFFIPGLGESHYCGYYGTDIGESKRRLEKCDIDSIVKMTEERNKVREKEKVKLSRRVESETSLGRGKKMIVKVLAAKLQEFEDDGLGYADVCIKSEDGRIEGIEGVDLDRTGALAVIILVRES